jgi:hypothetical protein
LHRYVHLTHLPVLWTDSPTVVELARPRWQVLSVCHREHQLHTEQSIVEIFHLRGEAEIRISVDQRYRLSLRVLCLHGELYRGIWPQHSFHAESFAVMSRWRFIWLGIFYEMVAFKNPVSCVLLVRHSHGDLVFGKHIGWFTGPLLVGVGLARNALACSFFNQRICSVTKGTAGD